MRVLVFDLDDTLYDESTFVRSGFLAVSRYVHQTYGFADEQVFSFLWNHFLKHGRNRVFDYMLAYFNIYSTKNLKQCISQYRSHRPALKLDAEAEAFLKRFSNYPLYIVTDGNKIVQHNKLEALGLTKRVKFCYITHRYGLIHAKPSPHCFLKICEREKTTPKNIVYIGDNPNKDFVGIKPYGFVTIRLLKGAYRNVKAEAKFEADFQIESLDELDERFLNEHPPREE